MMNAINKRRAASVTIFMGMRAVCFMLMCGACAAANAQNVRQWDRYEVALKGPSTGNPFLDVTLSARFSNGDKTVTAIGFYDGEGTYKVRFMPEVQGEWSYETESNAPELSGKTGKFTCVAPSPANHGPVRVANQFHFAYADGTAYKQVGTTAYNWINQSEARKKQTLETLKTSPFNKVRMSILPMQYDEPTTQPSTQPTTRMVGPEGEPLNLPTEFAFEGQPLDKWDYTRLNPAYFRRVEQSLNEMADANIQADIILLFSNNKKMGFWDMGAEVDDRFIGYVVARLACYHNVWWSIANEWDLLRNKTRADWTRMGKLVQSLDPYNHLRGIHQARVVLNEDWMTHGSIQGGERLVNFTGGPQRTRATYNKPIVFDEIQYEGNIDRRWGRLPGKDMVHRFWVGTVGSVYVGHGETFNTSPWCSSGGVLIGESPPRIAFLKTILDASPPDGINPIEGCTDNRIGGKPGEYYLIYFGKDEVKEWTFELPAHGLAAGTMMRVEIIDTWNMTITPIDQQFKIIAHDDKTVRADGEMIKLPGTAMTALRITKSKF
jgi:hypothetical protein